TAALAILVALVAQPAALAPHAPLDPILPRNQRGPSPITMKSLMKKKSVVGTSPSPRKTFDLPMVRKGLMTPAPMVLHAAANRCGSSFRASVRAGRLESVVISSVTFASPTARWH